VASTHIIRRQVIDAQFDGTESDGFELQNRLLRLSQDGLAPALENLLDRLTAPGEHWTIDLLEIDAGSVPFDNLDRLIGQVTDAVERKLRELPSRTISPSGGTPTKGRARTRPAPEFSGSRRSESIEVRSDAQSIGQAFLYFLETGVLPWWFQLPAGKALEEVILELWQRVDSGGGRPSSFARVLREGIRSTPFRRRLVRQFSSDFLMELLSAVSEEAAAAVRDMLSALREHGIADPTPPEFLQAAWETAFLIACSGSPVGPDTLVATLLQTVPPAVWEKDLSVRERIETIWPVAGSRPVLKPAGGQEQGALDLEEGVFTPCAGLVLLHPFLPRFFEALGIAEKGALLQPERAVCVLHHLATGLRFAPEYDLLVPKVLCNLPVDTPVNSQMELTAAEEEECVALLQAVVRHWSALANSSIENLRGSFLVRAGKLSERDGEHLLQVETRSYDVLLDQLPWGLALVKLPWMKKSLWVEWRF